MSHFRKILVPTDFSAGAEHALMRAIELGATFGASVTLLHAYDLPIVYSEFYSIGPDALRSIEDSARAHMAKLELLAQRHAREHDAGATPPVIDSKIVSGDASYAIVEEAKHGGFDLIVMGTHGRTGVSHLLIGSIAERVVRSAPCAVLTIRGRSS